jgi:hypothetical protein
MCDFPSDNNVLLLPLSLLLSLSLSLVAQKKGKFAVCVRVFSFSWSIRNQTSASPLITVSRSIAFYCAGCVVVALK